MIVFTARLAVVVLLYVAIGRSIRFPEMTMAISVSVVYALAGAVLLTLLQAAVNTWRWRVIARPIGAVPAFGASFLAYVEGLFVNQALPSFVGGDTLRVIRWREHRVALADAIASVLIDRVYGLLGVGCLGLAAIGLMWPFAFARHWLALGALASAGIVIACLGVCALQLWRRRPRFAQASGRAATLARGLLRFRARGQDVLVCIVISLAGQTMSGLGVLLLARGLDIDVPAALLICATSLVVLVSMIPISLAGWGVREASFLALLTPLDVTPERAVLLGILVGFQGLVAAMIGGVSLLFGLAAGPDR